MALGSAHLYLEIIHRSYDQKRLGKLAWSEDHD